MKVLICLMIYIQAGIFPLLGQGAFAACNPTARTRICSIDGPLAGEEILGQMLAGSQFDNLLPVGDPLPHRIIDGMPTGALPCPEIVVPFCPIASHAFVQLWAWDSQLWGTDYSAVPSDQFGRTDIVTVYLAEPGTSRLSVPHFLQPAIVPIPEPSVVVLLVAGCIPLVLFRAMNGRRTRRSVPGHVQVGRDCGGSYVNESIGDWIRWCVGG